VCITRTNSSLHLWLSPYRATHANDQRGVYCVHALHGARSRDDAAQALATGGVWFFGGNGVRRDPDAASGLRAVLRADRGVRDSRNFPAFLLHVQGPKARTATNDCCNRGGVG